MDSTIALLCKLLNFRTESSANTYSTFPVDVLRLSCVWCPSRVVFMDSGHGTSPPCMLSLYEGQRIVIIVYIPGRVRF
jgi:hypothetical protein